MSIFIYSTPPDSLRSKKSVPAYGIFWPYRWTHISSYSDYQIICIAVCSVLSCTGGFCYSPHSMRKGGENVVSKEYREHIERRFHAFCKVVLHNEVCNYCREQKRREQHEISLDFLCENTFFKFKTVGSGLKVPIWLPTAEQVAKPWKTVKGRDKRLHRPWRFFMPLLLGNQGVKATDCFRPSQSMENGYRCHPIESN